MTVDGVILGFMLTLIASALSVGACWALFYPQLRAMTEVATRQSVALNQQAENIARLLDGMEEGDATAEELGYDGKG